MSEDQMKSELKSAIKSYPGFPKENIIFRDFLPILRSPKLFTGMIDLFVNYLKKSSHPVDCIIGLESRGFLIGPPLALKLGIPFVCIRKSGKLPGDVKKEMYSLEYGSDAFEIQADSVQNGQRIVIVDDLLATGGTMEASVKLIKSCGALVELCMVVIELEDLKGCLKVPAPIYSLFKY